MGISCGSCNGCPAFCMLAANDPMPCTAARRTSISASPRCVAAAFNSTGSAGINLKFAQSAAQINPHIDRALFHAAGSDFIVQDLRQFRGEATASCLIDSPASPCKAPARFTAACQRVSLLPRSCLTYCRGSFPICASQWNNSHTTTIMATITPGIRNNCTRKPALGGSTGGKASSGENDLGDTGLRHGHLKSRKWQPAVNPMQLLDLTLDTPAENLALDEALLEEAEQSDRTKRSAAVVGIAANDGRRRQFDARGG